MTNPGSPSRSTSTAPIAASAARVCDSVQPVHHFTSVTVAGPFAVSQRRASVSRASVSSSGGRGRGNHEAAGTQRHWLLVQAPRGRPRTIRPSAASRKSTHVVMPVLLAHFVPSPKDSFFRRSGTSWDSSDAYASPRASSASMVAAAALSSHAAPFLAMPPSSISFV